MGVPKYEAGPGQTVVWGIPFDLGVTNRSGQREGPAAIRHASMMLCDGVNPRSGIDPMKAMRVVDFGDINLFRDMTKDMWQIENLADRHITLNNHLITLGGDHTISLPILRALSLQHGRMALVHFDAHLDTWPVDENNPLNHGSPFYMAVREGLIDPQHSIQIGIRSPAPKEVQEWTANQGFRTLSAKWVHEWGIDHTISAIRNAVGDMPVYLTVDIDCLDPAFAPGTGTPEIGGLASWQVLGILQNLEPLNFVGADFVEVLPSRDVSEITSLSAATFAWEYINLLAQK